MSLSWVRSGPPLRTTTLLIHWSVSRLRFHMPAWRKRKERVFRSRVSLGLVSGSGEPLSNKG